MLIHRGNIIAGGGTIVMPMTRAEYEANKTVLDSADVWVDLTDEPDSVADGECIQYNPDMNFEDIGNIATKAIAKVEPSDTALYLHPVGSYFINKDGNSCKTDVQISVGGTITLGTNCHVVDGVANDINSNLSQVNDYASSLTFPTGASGATFTHMFRQGRIASLQLYATYSNGVSGAGSVLVSGISVPEARFIQATFVKVLDEGGIIHAEPFPVYGDYNVLYARDSAPSGAAITGVITYFCTSY